MGQAAYKTLIGVLGEATAVANEPTTYIGDCVFQITDSTRRKLDTNTNVVVKFAARAGGAKSTLNVNDYTVNYVAGTITILEDSAHAANCAGLFLFVNAKYIPFTNVVGANQYSLELTGDVLEDTSFDKTAMNGGFRTKRYGLLDVSASVTRFDDLQKGWKTKLTERSIVILTFLIGENETAQGRFIIESISTSGEVAGLESEQITFQLDGNADNNFSWI